MFSPVFLQGLTSILIGLGSLVVATMPASARSDDVTLSEQSMTQAIAYLSLLRGQDISTEESTWLKQEWGEEFEASPQTVAAEVDELAFSWEHHQHDQDPLALANGRTAMVKNAYCAAEQNSDPLLHRLREILAPDDVVLAADCVFGFVVTRFDVDGLVASHALTAAATGQRHDAGNDKAEVIDTIKDGFADAAPAEKALIANGELRQAILARFWSRIDGAPEQRAVIDEVRSAAASDLRGTARQLERLALSRLGEVDYLAKVGDARLTTAAINSYSQWLGRIAGYSFSIRDWLWLKQAIINEFQDDPAKMLGEVAGIKDMNSAYVRAGSLSEKSNLVASWAANLHCYLSTSSDPDEIRLAEMVFRHDPVTEADCQASRVSRKSDTVLAEASGQRLTVQDLSTSMRFASIMLGRPLLPDEETVVRNDNVQSFNEDLEAWNEEHDFFRVFVDKIESRNDSRFLAVDERKKLFDVIYCELKKSDDAFADDYVKMFQRGDAVIFEDCDRQLVTTRDEIDAIVSFINFLNLVNEKPPLSEADMTELRQSLTSENMDGAESSMSAVNEWWSLLTLDEKAAEVAKIRENGITAEADSGTIANFVNEKKGLVVLQNIRRKQCQMMAIITQGNTNIYAAKQGRSIYNDNGGIAGLPGEEYATLVTSTNMFAEFCS